MAVLFMSPSFDIDGAASRPYQPLVGGDIPAPALTSPDCEMRAGTAPIGGRKRLSLKSL
jgi:hypothetical protein